MTDSEYTKSDFKKDFTFILSCKRKPNILLNLQVQEFLIIVEIQCWSKNKNFKLNWRITIFELDLCLSYKEILLEIEA